MAGISDTRILKMNDDEILQNLQEKRTRCIVYTRVMGYHRPVESFNIGKKGEHAERVKFEENLTRQKNTLKNLKKFNIWTRNEADHITT